MKATDREILLEKSKVDIDPDYTVQDACNSLHISRRTWYYRLEAIKEKEEHAIKVQEKCTITLEEIDAEAKMILEEYRGLKARMKDKKAWWKMPCPECGEIIDVCDPDLRLQNLLRDFAKYVTTWKQAMQRAVTLIDNRKQQAIVVSAKDIEDFQGEITKLAKLFDEAEGVE